MISLRTWVILFHSNPVLVWRPKPSNMRLVVVLGPLGPSGIGLIITWGPQIFFSMGIVLILGPLILPFISIFSMGQTLVLGLLIFSSMGLALDLGLLIFSSMGLAFILKSKPHPSSLIPGNLPTRVQVPTSYAGSGPGEHQVQAQIHRGHIQMHQAQAHQGQAQALQNQANQAQALHTAHQTRSLGHTDLGFFSRHSMQEPAPSFAHVGSSTHYGSFMNHFGMSQTAIHPDPFQPPVQEDVPRVLSQSVSKPFQEKVLRDAGLSDEYPPPAVSSALGFAGRPVYSQPSVNLPFLPLVNETIKAIQETHDTIWTNRMHQLPKALPLRVDDKYILSTHQNYRFKQFSQTNFYFLLYFVPHL